MAEILQGSMQAGWVPSITLHGRITAREYTGRLGNQVNPMIQTLFENNDALFQENNTPIHTLELFSHDLKSIKVRPPHSNITEPLWSVFGDE
jgi:hypothetical protein